MTRSSSDLTLAQSQIVRALNDEGGCDLDGLSATCACGCDAAFEEELYDLVTKGLVEEPSPGFYALTSDGHGVAQSAGRAS